MSTKVVVFAYPVSSSVGKKKKKDRHRTASEVLNTTMASPQKPNSKLLTFALQALVMALVVSLFLLFLAIAALVLAGRALARRLRWAVRPPGRELPCALTGISSKELLQLPEFDYGGDPADCAVCLDSFVDGERCRALPACGHVFHVHCVDRWLARTPACPVCRAVVAGVRTKAVVVDDGGGGFVV